MCKNLVMLSVFVLIVFSCNIEDASSPKPEDIFVKYFGVSGQQKAIDVVFNESKNEFFILGSQNLGDATSTNFYYLVTDIGGNLLYSDTVDFKDTTNVSLIDVPTRIKQMDDNTYLVVGTATDANEQSFVVWGTVSHDLQDQKYDIVQNETAPFDLSASDIILTDAGANIILLGTTSKQYPGDLASPSSAGKQYFLSKRSKASNEMVWSKTLGVAGNDMGVAVFELQDGKLAVFGATESDTEGTRVNAVFLNALGTADGAGEAYGIEIDGLHNDVPMAVIDGGIDFKVVGTSTLANGDKRAFMMGISRYGNLDLPPLGLQSDFGADLSTSASTVTRTLDGGYLIMGSYPSFQIFSTEIGEAESRLEEMMLMKTDADGVKIDGLDQYYGLESGNDRANRAITLPDGRVVVVGTFDFGSGTTLIGLLKLNSRGELKQ